MMDNPVSPLVLTKLRAPAVRPRTISRARLINLLAPENDAGFILVCAPAGYGKTTFLAEWAQSLIKGGTAVAWYALDAADDAPIPFCSYLIASFIQVLGPLPELTQVAQLLRSSPEVDPLRILPTLINAVTAAGQDCVLILDDYHLITAPAIHSALAYLLDHRPENLRIAAGSRADPPLPLARLRARGQMLEIRAASLRFTEAEAALFLNDVMKLELPPEGVAVLAERTEGWVAGLQLAAIALAGQADKEPDIPQGERISSFTGSHRYLVEYLLDEVVNRQPEDVRSFLLATSVLERMCSEECEDVIRDSLIRDSSIRDSLSVIRDAGETPASSRETNDESRIDESRITYSSQAILDYLYRSNLFLIPLDEEGRWFRYHHLFRDFLRARLNKTWPERVIGLHHAACAWLAAHGFLREAAGHAFQTQDWEYAAAFVEQHSFTLILHSEIATIAEWCSAFPEAVMQAHPMLCIMQGLALAYRFRGQNQARVEARLRQADQAIAALADRQRVRELVEMAAVVRTFLAMVPDPAADPHQQLALSRSMLDFYPEGNPGRFSGLLTSGYAYLALQDAQAANQALETARQFALRGNLYFGIVESTFHLARLAHSQGQLRRASEICQQGQADLAALLPHPEQVVPALGCLDVALGCVLMEQDRLGEAEECLLRGLRLMGWGMNPFYLMTACTALARLYEILDRPAKAVKQLALLEEAWPDIAFCTRGLRALILLRAAPQDFPTAAEAAGAEAARADSAGAEAVRWSQSFNPLPAGCGEPAGCKQPGEDALLPGIGPLGAAEVYYLAGLAWAAVQIATGGARTTLPYLAHQLELAERNGLTSRVIELSLLQAQAHQAAGDHQQARTALARGLAAARPEGHTRIFDQGPGLARLLQEAADRGMCREDIRRIQAVLVGSLSGGMAASGGTPESAATRSQETVSSIRLAAEPVYTEPLSERELEILRLIAQGATNQAIAERLVITVGTVKSHINHILGKLAVHNRTEAVARARDNHLI